MPLLPPAHQSLEQMDGLKKSIRALTAQVEQLEAERSRHWASSAGASAKADETIRQLEAQLRAAQQRIHQAEVDAEAVWQQPAVPCHSTRKNGSSARCWACPPCRPSSQAAQDAGSQIARLQEQALEHVQTINRLHEELRESRQFILTNTEASLASERQLGQLEQSLRHEQESRQRAEAELATAKGNSYCTGLPLESHTQGTRLLARA